MLFLCQFMHHVHSSPFCTFQYKLQYLILIIFLFYNSSVLDYTYQTLNNDVPQTLNQTAVSYNYARGAGLERSTAINCTLSLDMDACITDGETEPYHKRVLNQQKKDKEKKPVKSSQTPEGEKPNKTSPPTYNSVRDPRQRTVSSPEKPSPSLATPEDDDDDEADGSGTESDYTPEKEKGIMHSTKYIFCEFDFFFFQHQHRPHSLYQKQHHMHCHKPHLGRRVQTKHHTQKMLCLSLFHLRKGVLVKRMRMMFLHFHHHHHLAKLLSTVISLDLMMS